MNNLCSSDTSDETSSSSTSLSLASKAFCNNSYRRNLKSPGLPRKCLSAGGAGSLNSGNSPISYVDEDNSDACDDNDIKDTICGTKSETAGMADDLICSEKT